MERDDGQAASRARTSIAHEGLESRGRDERLHKNALAAAARRLEPLHRITDLREVRRPPRLSLGGQNQFMARSRAGASRSGAPVRRRSWRATAATARRRAAAARRYTRITSSTARRAEATARRTSPACAPRTTCTACTWATSASAARRPMRSSGTWGRRDKLWWYEETYDEKCAVADARDRLVAERSGAKARSPEPRPGRIAERRRRTVVARRRTAGVAALARAGARELLLAAGRGGGCRARRRLGDGGALDGGER